MGVDGEVGEWGRAKFEASRVGFFVFHKAGAYRRGALICPGLYKVLFTVIRWTVPVENE
jgi:hypothetical protein